MFDQNMKQSEPVLRLLRVTAEIMTCTSADSLSGWLPFGTLARVRALFIEVVNYDQTFAREANVG